MGRQILMSCVEFDQEIKDGKLKITEVAPVAKRLGLDGVEYREVYWHDKSRELPAVRDQLAELGIRGTYATFGTLYNRDSAARASLLQDIADAKALGSTLIRVFRGELPEDGAAGAASRDGAREAIERAAKLGLTIALENFARSPGNRLADIVGALDAFNSPTVGTNLDVSNYVMNGDDPIAAIRALGPRIRFVHLKDVKETPEGKTTTYIGAGSLPYRDILAELDRAGQDFPLCFEFGGEGDPEGGIRKSLAYIRAL